MEELQQIPETPEQPTLPEPVKNPQPSPAVEAQQSRVRMIILGIVAVLLLGLVIAAIVYLAGAPEESTSRIRDIFIILMALESLVIGVALIVLIIQLAILTNLIQNDLKPILNSTNETVNTLRGTVIFLSDNLAEPVIKLNEFLAGVKKFSDLVRPGRR